LAEFWAEFGKTIIGNLTEFSVYLIIIIIFTVAFMKCIMPVITCRNCLKKAARKLRRSEQRDIWQDKNFLGKRSPLSVHWTAYLNSRLFANDEYHNASPLEDYINEETAVYEPGFAILGDSVPGIMVSLGFLGTLFGIVMGLSDINMSDANMTMSSISGLLEGMKYAFTTSIVGVIASLSFQVLQRWAQNSTSHALVVFQNAMRTEAHVVTVDPMTQITIYQQEQTAQLQAIAEELTTRMPERMGKTLETALQPMRQSLEGFITVTTREQLKGLDMIVNNFVSRMNDSLSGQFHNLSASIEETCRWHRETQETVRATIDGLNRVSRDIMQIQQLSESLIVKFDGYISRLGAAQHQVEEGFSTVNVNVRNMETVARQQSSYIAQIAQMQSDFMREVSAFQSRMDTFSKAYIENTNQSVSALQKVSAELKSSGKGMRESGEKLIASHEAFAKGVHAELQQAYGVFDANVEDTIKGMNSVMEAIRTGMENVPVVMGEASAQYAEQMAQLIEYMKETENMLSRALGQMENTRPASRITEGGGMY